MKSLLLVGGVLSVALQPAATEVTGARISILATPQRLFVLTVENRRSSPLIETSIGFKSPDGKLSGGIQTNYFTEAPFASPGSIPPGGRHAIDVAPPVQGAYTPVLRLAVFADGYAEGDRDTLDSWLKEHRRRVDDLTYWSRVLEGMPRVSEPDLRRYLSDRMADAADAAGIATRGPNESFRILHELDAILRSYPSGPQVWTPLDKLRDDTRLKLAEVTRRPVDGPAELATEAIKSVAIVVEERSDAREAFAEIENLRNVTIEAFGFELLDGLSGRPMGGQRADYCTVPPGPQDGRRIQPHAKARIPLSMKASGEQPRIAFTFILWDDLHFEGSVAARDRLLRDREDEAEDETFAIGVIREALETRPKDLREFLSDRRAMRVRLQIADGRRVGAPALDGIIRTLPLSQQDALKMLEGYESSLVASRDRLLRHRAQPDKR